MDANKNWEILKRTDPEIYDALIGEEKREQKGLIRCANSPTWVKISWSCKDQFPKMGIIL